MKILSKIKTTTRRNKPCQKDKNIERPIIAEFKTNFYQGVFYGFSKRESVKSRGVSQSHDQRQSGGG
ncbi:hypothetical protein HpVH12_13040 [Helicobacter pylori]